MMDFGRLKEYYYVAGELEVNEVGANEVCHKRHIKRTIDYNGCIHRRG